MKGKKKTKIRIRLFHIKDKDVLNVKKQPEVTWALPGFPRYVLFILQDPMVTRKKQVSLLG